MTRVNDTLAVALVAFLCLFAVLLLGVLIVVSGDERGQRHVEQECGDLVVNGICYELKEVR